MKTRVSVFGGGISGLTIAHELIEKGFEVHLYELTDSIGGMAKSVREPIYHIPTEHSWRGYWPFYKNCFNILSRIPVERTNTELFTRREIKREIKVFSKEEISKHNTKEYLWCYYKTNVYDLTKFVDQHPGGYIILKAAGKNLEEVWNNNGVSWHITNHEVVEVLEKYKIGELEKESFSKESFNQNGLTAFDNLATQQVNIMLLQNDETDIEKQINISIQDYPYLTYLYLTVLLSDERRKEMFETPFLPLIQNKVTQETFDYLSYFVFSTGIGINISLTSFAHFGLFINLQFAFGNPFNPRVKVMNQPTSEAWFDFWKRYLEKKGVIFHSIQNYNKLFILINKFKNASSLLKKRTIKRSLVMNFVFV